MQADAVNVEPVNVDHSTRPSTAAHVAGALRAVESFLFAGGQQTARRNAWNAVCEDRKRARDRREALSVFESAPRRVRPNSP